MLKSTPSNDGVRRVNMQIGFRLSLDDLAHALALHNEFDMETIEEQGKAKVWRMIRGSLQEKGTAVVWGDEHDDEYDEKFDVAKWRILKLKLVQWEPLGVSARRGEMRTVQ